MVVWREHGDPRYSLEFLASNLGPVGRLPNVFRLCLSGVDIGVLFLFRGWAHVGIIWADEKFGCSFCQFCRSEESLRIRLTLYLPHSLPYLLEFRAEQNDMLY